METKKKPKIFYKIDLAETLNHLEEGESIDIKWTQFRPVTIRSTTNRVSKGKINDFKVVESKGVSNITRLKAWK